MSLDNEESIRRVYQLAELKDVAGFVGAFTDDGVFTDQSGACPGTPSRRRQPSVRSRRDRRN